MDIDLPELWEGDPSSSSASSTLGTPSRSPEPMYAHVIDHSSIDSELAAALEQMELVSEEETHNPALGMYILLP